jgi:hypothetical protein
MFRVAVLEHSVFCRLSENSPELPLLPFSLFSLLERERERERNRERQR